METNRDNTSLVVFLSTIKSKKKPSVLAVLRASFFLVRMDLFSLLPTAIIAYANLEINIPTHLKSKKISAVCRKIGIKLYFASFLYVSKYCKINGCKHSHNKYAMFSFIRQEISLSFSSVKPDL